MTLPVVKQLTASGLAFNYSPSTHLIGSLNT